MSGTEQVFGWAFAYGGGAGKSAAQFWRDYSTKLTHEQRLAQVRFIARMMDDQFRVPGTKLRFGLDLVLGLFPGLGDVVTSAISLFIVGCPFRPFNAFAPHGLISLGKRLTS